MRDTQKSRVYGWERAYVRDRLAREFYDAELSFDAAEALMREVWMAERARYGRGRKPVPELLYTGRGGTASFGPNGGRVRLGTTVRTKWVLLHEIAHHLAGFHEGHGPRFVGVLIGLLNRHMQLDAQELVDTAAEAGVRVLVQSIGVVYEAREKNLAQRILPHLPGRITQVAWRAGCRPSQARGAAITLIRRGLARYYRGRLVPA